MTFGEPMSSSPHFWCYLLTFSLKLPPPGTTISKVYLSGSHPDRLRASWRPSGGFTRVPSRVYCRVSGTSELSRLVVSLRAPVQDLHY